MIAIGPAAKNLEGKIDLRWRAKLDYVMSAHGGEGYRMKDEVNPKNANERIIVALDSPQAASALELVRELKGAVSFFKIGLQLYTAAGPEIVRAVSATGAKVFLDLKLHDIPNTVGKAVAAAGELGVAMLTIHLSGGRKMIEAALKECPPHLLLLGVTVLTSSDEATLHETGVDATPQEQTLRLAALAAAAGMCGLIASPHEVQSLRNLLGLTMTIITPGVRPSWSGADDQKRFATPRAAIDHGANYLVIGRPITAASNPREAAEKIISELV